MRLKSALSVSLLASTLNLLATALKLNNDP